MRAFGLFIVCAVLTQAYVHANEFVDENGNKIEENIAENVDAEIERAKKSTDKLQVQNLCK
jgi:hypothetical protein